jgi:O-antigen ligase
MSPYLHRNPDRSAAAGLAIATTACLTISLEQTWWGLVLGGLIFGWAAFALSEARTSDGGWPALLAAGPALLAAAQMLTGRAPVPWVALDKSLYWGALIAFFVACRYLFRTPAATERYVVWTSVLATVICALATAQFFTSEGRLFWIWPTGQPDVFGPFQSRNNYASFAVLVLPVALWKGFGRNGFDWRWMSGAGLLAGSVLASGSRAGAALVCLEVLTAGFLHMRRTGWSRRSLSAVGATLGLLLISTWVTGVQALRYKLGDADPMRYRREMALSAAQMVREQPILGVGLGHYPLVYPAYALFDSGRRVNHAHNDWLECAAEGGIVFAGVAVALGLWTAVLAWREPWALGVPAVLLHGLVDYPMQRFGVALWVVAMAAALFAARKRL